MFTFRFNIEEQPDAKSFLFYDITGDYSVENTTGWGIENSFEYSDITSASITMRSIKTKTNDVFTFDITSSAILWKDGIEVFKDELGDTFQDGAYEFNVYFNDSVVSSSNRNFGFAALIKAEVMTQSLNYRPDMDRRLKETIYEKIRLLDNMFYAGETNQIEYFIENLESLKKLR